MFNWFVFWCFFVYDMNYCFVVIYKYDFFVFYIILLNVNCYDYGGEFLYSSLIFDKIIILKWSKLWRF